MTEGSDMLIVKFNHHVHIRLGEWLSSLILATLGLLLFAAPHMFENDALFVVMRQFAPQQVWAFTALFFASGRITALYINGRKPITPYVRMALAFFSCFIWWNFALGVLLSGKPALSLATFPWLLVLDVYNVFRASADARESFDNKRASRDGTGQA